MSDRSLIYSFLNQSGSKSVKSQVKSLSCFLFYNQGYYIIINFNT
jgi:hypothetical protein